MADAIVRSADGTRIAFEVGGAGPTVILIDTVGRHRALSSFRDVVAMLAADFTVVQYDRRGRGQSAFRRGSTVRSEVDDIAALLEQLGGPVHLLGYRSGGLLAVHAARWLPIERVAVHDAPFMYLWDRLVLVAYCDAIAKGGRRRSKRDRALEHLLATESPPDEQEAARRTGEWKAMASAGRTFALDCALRTDTTHAFLADVKVPVLVLDTLAPDPVDGDSAGGDPVGRRAAGAMPGGIHPWAASIQRTRPAWHGRRGRGTSAPHGGQRLMTCSGTSGAQLGCQ